jgi:ubiquinol-cytochrome c reductase cytochrome c subunit
VVASVLATVAVTLLLTGLVGASQRSDAAPGGVARRQAEPEDAALIEEGRELYMVGCVSCHGPDGTGQDAPDGSLRGPSLVDAGEAGAYYQLTSGRMPLGNPTEVPSRKPPAYSMEEIDALVAFVASLGDGPELPEVDLEAGDLAEGGVLFRENCQACHSATGAGGALSYGRAAPPLADATPSQIAAAIRSGPGPMPRFGPEILDDEQVDGVVRYVTYLEEPDDRGGLALGRLGPIPEGFLIWVGGLGLLLVVAFWLGTRRSSQPWPPDVATAADAPVPAPDASAPTIPPDETTTPAPTDEDLAP